MAGNLTEPGARHRQGRDRGRQRRPEAEADGRGQGRDRRAGRHDQQHDRHAGDVRRPGDDAWPARSASKASSAARPSVPGAAGTWKDLTDNVNQLAANLTTQVRAIAEVATAVTKGDLTRSITVEAQGEVAALKDNINEMIRNLQGHDAEEHRAGLAEDQPRQVQPHAAGPERPADGRPADPVRAGAGGRRAARPCSTCSTTPTDDSRSSRCSPATPTRAQDALGKRVRARRGPGRPVRAREARRSCSTNVPPRLHPHHLRPRRGAAAATSSCCRWSSRARCKAVIELASLRALQPDAPGVPRPAHRVASASCSTRSRRTCGRRTC